ncbi:MAG: EAL domain-containing protein [Gallionella sp.]
MKIRRLGLITRIALLVVCVEVAAFGVLGWFYVDRFSKTFDEHLQMRMRLLGRMVANDELPISTISQRSIVSDLLGAPYLNGMVIGGNGRIIVSTNPANLGRSATSVSGFDAGWIADSAPDTRFIPSDDSLTAVFRIRDANGEPPLYSTVITISTSDLNATKHSIFRWGLLVSLLFILLSSAGIVFIAQRLITRRVNASLKVLKTVEDGDMNARIRVSSEDELGRLQHGINSMTEKVGNLLNQHRRNEEEIRATSRLLDSIVENIPNTIFLKRASDLSYVLFNKACERMLGFKREDMLGKNAYDLFSRETAEQLTVADRDVLRSPQILDIPEETLTTHDGSQLILHTQKLALYNDRSEAEYLLGISEDITERKNADSDLRIAATAFEAQEGMMITDANGMILRVNQAFINDTGFTAEELVGKTPRLLKSGRHDADFYRAMWQSINATGSWQGEIWDRRKNGEIYPKWLSISAVKGNDGAVTHYVGSHIDITERKSAEKEIRLLAYYDPLTRLPNRRLLMDRLQQAVASGVHTGREGALLLIDLDNFKTINDTLGHHIGDQLLQQIAQRLESCVRDGDTVARLGGDEFVVILENLSEHAFEAAAQAETVGEKILAALSQPYQFGAHEYHSAGSIGITLFNDKLQATGELLKQADIAMYQAKKAGRNTLRFFDPKMQASINARVSLESEMRQALEKRQFQLHYQIQVDSSHHPIGAEALIRWLHPERGMVSPVEFIPLAEESGLMLPIGHWVLDTACAQLKAWQQAPNTRDLLLAVNVSAKQFRQADFVAQMQATLQRHGINPTRLKLELTESLLLDDIEDTIATMNVLSEIGVQFSLDDFGTGYSSLQYLKRLPLDQLKIDRSFVRDIVTDNNDKAIVRTIAAMAKSMDISVIAEGVETEEQRQLLLKNGCSNFQGYLFSRPVPIEQLEALLQQT